MKFFFIFEVKLDKVKTRKKILNFLRGPTVNFKPKFDGTYFRKPGKRSSLKYIKNFQVSLKEKKNNRFKVYQKNKTAKKAIPANVTLVNLNSTRCFISKIKSNIYLI